MLPLFEYHRAETAQEAVQMLRTYAGDAKIVAGGTDIFLQLSRGKVRAGHLISLSKVTSLNRLEDDGEYIAIGANTTHRTVEMSPLVSRELVALHEATGRVGSVQVRNVATVAGNLCNAAPSADTAAPLLVHNALLRVLGPQGERLIELADFFRGPGRNSLTGDEVVLEILVPKPSHGGASAYIKHARRKAMDLALIGVAVYVTCSEDLTHFKEVKIALSTVAPTPIRAVEAEKALKGSLINEESLRVAAEAAAQGCSPRTSWRSDAKYRRQMVEVLVKRSLRLAIERCHRK